MLAHMGSTSYQELCFVQVPIHGMRKRQGQSVSCYLGPGEKEPCRCSSPDSVHDPLCLVEYGCGVDIVQPPQELKKKLYLSHGLHSLLRIVVLYIYIYLFMNDM